MTAPARWAWFLVTVKTTVVPAVNAVAVRAQPSLTITKPATAAIEVRKQ